MSFNNDYNLDFDNQQVTLSEPQTARNFIELAMKEAGILGVGQTLLAEDINDGFIYLQRMLKTWQAKRWMVNALQDISLTPPNQNRSQTIGPGGVWNIYPKPDKIAAGYFFQKNTSQPPINLPLALIMSYEDYARITLKDLVTQPEYLFYDNQNNLPPAIGTPPVAPKPIGLGNIFIWPIPTVGIYEIHLICKVGLGWPATLDSVYYLADVYAEAIHYNLAMRFCSAYGKEPKAITKQLAAETAKTVKNSNIQIPEMIMPSGLRNGKAFSLWNPDGY